MGIAVADMVVQHDMNTSALGDPIGLLSGINEIYLPCDKKMMATLKECLEQKKRESIGSELSPRVICLCTISIRKTNFMSVSMR